MYFPFIFDTGDKYGLSRNGRILDEQIESRLSKTIAKLRVEDEEFQEFIFLWIWSAHVRASSGGNYSIRFPAERQDRESTR
jgi:hypothetical protein